MVYNIKLSLNIYKYNKHFQDIMIKNMLITY